MQKIMKMCHVKNNELLSRASAEAHSFDEVLNVKKFNRWKPP